MPRRVAVFVAWPYANGPLHVGHVGGSLLPPDIFARYHRMAGSDVMMVSGSDTHGTPVTLRAEEEGKPPADVYREWHESFIDTYLRLGISFDLFTHTDTANHHRVAQDMFLKLLDQGALIKGKDKQLYDPERGRYLPDRFVEGTCPHCGYENARGDQCDNCGRILDATELIDPRPRGGDDTPLEVHEREHFFLDLPQFSERLEEWLSAKSNWRTAVRNNSLGQIREGLKPRPITRDLDWGVPVPVEGWEDRVLYVWFEAVVGYLSGSIELAQLRDDPDAWRETWYDPDAETYYFMGKDNVPFHAVIWPAMLLGAEDLHRNGTAGSLNLPTDVVSNEYVNMEGGAAMSTSRNYAVWLPEYLESYDPDPLRYFLTITAPETKDSEFSWSDFVRRNNDELLATWGNLVNRVLRFTHSRFEGQVPTPRDLAAADTALLERAEAAFDSVGVELEARRFKSALIEAMAVAHEANRYLNDQAPWASIKEDREAAATTIYVALQAIDHLHRLLAPFLPHTSEQVHRYLGYEDRLFGDLRVEEVGEGNDRHRVLRYDSSSAQGSWKAHTLAPGRALRQPDVIVSKLDEDEVIERERQRVGAT